MASGAKMGVGGWAFTVPLLPLCIWNRLGRKVVVTNQRVVVTRLFGKTEMRLGKIESIDTSGVAGPGALSISIRGTCAGGISFSPLQRAAAIELALRNGVALARQR